MENGAPHNGNGMGEMDGWGHSTTTLELRQLTMPVERSKQAASIHLQHGGGREQRKFAQNILLQINDRRGGGGEEGSEMG